MPDQSDHIAAVANIGLYDGLRSADYIDGAPHIKHASLRRLYAELLIRVYDRARLHNEVPTVLDLGAGEGSVTLPFLELGARVTAVDISQNQLQGLRNRCGRFADRLELVCEDVSDAVRRRDSKYDIVVFNSFLHHVPDYLGLIKDVMPLLTEHGQVFSFQDPMRYDRLNRFTSAFAAIAYYSWRLAKGDLFAGAARWLRRRRGVYLPDSVHDNAEYHVVRNGVDADAIVNLLRESGFATELIGYFGTQGRIWQWAGTKMRLKNMFGLLAWRSTANIQRAPAGRT